MKKNILICLGTFACYLGKAIQKRAGDNLTVWMVDGNNPEKLGNDISRCTGNDRIILLTAPGGGTASKLSVWTAERLDKGSLTYGSVIILPHLIEGGSIVARALWTADRLFSSDCTHVIENFPFAEGISSVRQSVDALMLHVYTKLMEALQGKAVASESKEALENYRERSLQQEQVLFSMGCMFMESRMVARDVCRATKLFMQAAAMGHAGAWKKLGDIHLEKEDYPNAMTAYRHAAYKGDAESCCRLGYMYSTGMGSEPDESMALHWYIKGAKGHHPEAILQMACMLLDGRGVEKNRQLGLRNLRLAAESGYKPAREDCTPAHGLKLAQKLTILVIESGLTARLYATRIGYPAARFQMILDGKAEGDIALLRAIIKAFPETDIENLIEED